MPSAVNTQSKESLSSFCRLKWNTVQPVLLYADTAADQASVIYRNYLPTHAILALIAHAQMPPLSNHADISSWYRGLRFGQCLYLYPICVYASNEDAYESAHLCRLAGAFIGQKCDKYQHVECWLNYYNVLFINLPLKKIAISSSDA